MKPLNQEHVDAVVVLLKQNILADVCREHGLMVGGGLIRAIVAGEQTSDIDLFIMKKADDGLFAQLKARLPNYKEIRTVNAVTYAQKDFTPIQLIHRWAFTSPTQLLEHFDFTVCGAVVYYDWDAREWKGICHDQFYEHTNDKKLVYSNPPRDNNEPGGTMLRVMKYVGRGYYCSPESFTRILTRLFVHLELEVYGRGQHLDEERIRFIVLGALREIDPMSVEGSVDPLIG